ncbi:MAG: sulfotransferase family protein [bacterium]
MMQRILELGNRPIVIGGCGRSGTTLLLSILSCHPKIFAIDIETTALCPDGYGEDGLYNQNPNLDTPFKLEKIHEYLLAHEIPESCTRWCEKTPRNVIYFERILRHFGKQARLIHIVRDGRDVVTSVHPREASRYWITPHRWVMDVAAGQRLEKHPQVLTIRYEDLVRNYEATIRRICEFIEEEYTDAFLRYPDSARVKESIAWFNLAQTMNDRSIGRWQETRFENIVDSLLQELGAVALLEHFGYLETALRSCNQPQSA